MSSPSSSTSNQQAPQPLSFKEQLDHKARLARDPNYGKEEPQRGLLEKVAEYIPAAANKILGAVPSETNSNKESSSTETTTPPGPPVRPEHDDKISDFVREQHRSKMGKNWDPSADE